MLICRSPEIYSIIDWVLSQRSFMVSCCLFDLFLCVKHFSLTCLTAPFFFFACFFLKRTVYFIQNLDVFLRNWSYLFFADSAPLFLYRWKCFIVFYKWMGLCVFEGMMLFWWSSDYLYYESLFLSLRTRTPSYYLSWTELIICL